MWVKSSKQISDHRDVLLEAQGGMDPILNEPIIKPCLDHDHFDGRCRGVLSQCVNTFEGQILKAWMKYVSEYTDTTLSSALRNMADYLEQDYSQMKIHGSYLSDMTKFLKRLSIDTIRRRSYDDLSVVIPDGFSKAEAIEAYLLAFIKKTEESIL